MDIFKFINPDAPTLMVQGEIINGLSSKTWIERYRDAGEFTLKAPVSAGIKDLLPLGTFISHVDTKEIMIVENHEINEDDQKEPELIVTGRGYETFLENRMVGSNAIFPMAGSDLHHTLAANYTWLQAVGLITAYIYDSELEDVNDHLPYVTVLATVTPETEDDPTVERAIQKGPLYNALIDLLKIDDLGIKVVRPNPLSTASPNTSFIIHRGIDRTDSVAFSFSTGEIITADYLWSIKSYKNAALISGRYVQTIAVLSTPTVPTGYGRRWMFIDGSDVDNNLTEPPTGSALLDVAHIMQQRGLDFLKSQTLVSLAKAQVSKEGTKAIYRTDYDLGDLITVHGDYGVDGIMQVTEYAEVEDDTGSSGYPTLSAIV